MASERLPSGVGGGDVSVEVVALGDCGCQQLNGGEYQRVHAAGCVDLAELGGVWLAGDSENKRANYQSDP